MPRFIKCLSYFGPNWSLYRKIHDDTGKKKYNDRKYVGFYCKYETILISMNILGRKYHFPTHEV